jgi:hypothetical protein
MTDHLSNSLQPASQEQSLYYEAPFTSIASYADLLTQILYFIWNMLCKPPMELLQV